jgi:hypothetical protein
VRGPAPLLPTPEQQARIPELRDRAHHAALLNGENHALLLAANHIAEAQEAIETAMQIRQRRKVAAERPETKPSPEVLAVEEAEQRWIGDVKVRDALAPATHRKAMEDWQADTLKYSESTSRLVRSARCLLRVADEIIRGEVQRAAQYEDVALPWEDEDDIFYRLAKDEAGLEKAALVRAVEERKIVDTDRAKEHFEALRNAIRRVGERADIALWRPRENYMTGLLGAGAPLESKVLAEVDEQVRRLAVWAWASPALHDEVCRLFPARPSRKKRQKRTQPRRHGPTT